MGFGVFFDCMPHGFTVAEKRTHTHALCCNVVFQPDANELACKIFDVLLLLLLAVDAAAATDVH